MENQHKKQMEKLIVGNLYKIKWTDSRHFPRWHDKTETQLITNRSEDFIETFGIFVGISSDNKFITISQSLDKKQGATGQKTKIPVCCVEEITDIETKDTFKIVSVSFLCLVSLLFFTDQLLRFDPVANFVTKHNLPVPHLEITITNYIYEYEYEIE